MRDQQQRAGELRQRVLQRLPALDVEVVGRLVEDQHVGARLDQDRERQPPPLAAGQTLERLLGVLAAEQEPAEQRPPAAGVRPVARWQASSTVRAVPPPISSACWERNPTLTLWPVRSLPVTTGPEPPATAASMSGWPVGHPGQPSRLRHGHSSRRRRTAEPRPASRSAWSCRRRWGRRPRRARRAPATAGRAPAGHGRRCCTPPSSSSNTTRPLRSGGLNANVRSRPSSRVALEPLDPVEPFLARLRLPRAGTRAEPRDELLEPVDLGLLALDRAPERQLAGRLLLAPLVPGAGEELSTASLQLEHRGGHRLEEPAVVRDQDHRRVEPNQMRLEPFERVDVEMVRRLVEQQQVGASGERAAQARPGSARRPRRCRADGRAPCRRRTRGRGASPARDRARCSRRRARARPGRRHTGSGSARRSRRRPFAARAPTARARAPAARERRRGCSHGASRLGRAEGAGRAVTPSSPSPARARRRRSTPRRRASAAGSSSRSRCDRTGVIRSRRSSLNEMPRSNGSPEMSLLRSEAMITAIGWDSRGGSRGHVPRSGLRGRAGYDPAMAPFEPVPEPPVELPAGADRPRTRARRVLPARFRRSRRRCGAGGDAAARLDRDRRPQLGDGVRRPDLGRLPGTRDRPSRPRPRAAPAGAVPAR